MSNQQLKCSICHEAIEPSDAYEYRGFVFCEPHFDQGMAKVDNKRGEVMEAAAHSVRSQQGGEWMNGGYRTMKIDASGSPIPSQLKEPQILKDYERGIL